MDADAPLIDAGLVERLVCSQFPEWAGLPVKPVRDGGWDNRTFHLGWSLLVRLPSAERYAAQVEKEQTWLPRLAPRLPVQIPEPIAMGRPGQDYPWPWSIYRWIEGETAASSDQCGTDAFASELAGFLKALHAVDATQGPAPGAHNFFRGGRLSVYDAQMRKALGRLDDGALAARVCDLWDQALATEWRRGPVWVHGDFAAGNLLVREGRLAAVIDFGCLAVGDPACDLTIAWTLLPQAARAAFRSMLGLDEAVWTRAKGWAAWKALILRTGLVDGQAENVARSEQILDEILFDS